MKATIVLIANNDAENFGRKMGSLSIVGVKSKNELI